MEPPRFARRLEELSTVEVHRYWMSIGYGDRVEIPGVVVDGQGFRLQRESSSSGVRSAIESARRSRRGELETRSG